MSEAQRLKISMSKPGAGEVGCSRPCRLNRNQQGHNTEHFDVACKVMLIGDSGVGKTCFLVRFKDNAFLAGRFISTVGIDFRNKILTVDGTVVKLQIWDTAGQERFRSITHAYYRDAHALLLLYDITNRRTFDNIRAWIGEIHSYASSSVLMMLLGNKADMVTHRQVSREEGESLAKEYDVVFMETSAKSGLNVDLAFTAIAKNLLNTRRCLLSPSHRNKDDRFDVREYVEREKGRPAACCFS